MKKFENFDESVRNKLDETNFQFSEANWEKMSQMIDASRPAKKPFGNVPLISSIVIGSALLIVSAWYFTTQTSDAKEVAQSNTVSVDPTNNANENTISAPLTSNTSENNSISTNSNTDLKVTATNNSNSSSANTERDELSGKNENNTIVNSVSNKKNAGNKSSNTTPANEFATGTKGSSEVNVTKSETSNTVPQEIIGETEHAHVKANANNNRANTDVSKTNTNSKSNIKPELGNVAQQQADQQTAGDNRNINAGDPEETDLIALQNTTTNLGQTEDAIAAANLKTAIEDKKVKEYVRIKHHTMNIEGGVSNSFGWRVNNTRNGNNISPILGFNYIYNIDSRSSVLAGLQYNGLANLGEAKANFSVTTFGFGINNEVTTYKLNDLHYAVMPVKFIYKLNKNNALGVGFNLMYLMNTRTEIINTTTLESSVTSTTSRYEYGYGFDQLNTFNGQLALSYNYAISKTLGLNFELNKSLSNVVKDYNYFGIKNQSSAPAAVKLSLTYTLFNK